jgi:hypothetical protein
VSAFSASSRELNLAAQTDKETAGFDLEMNGNPIEVQRSALRIKPLGEGAAINHAA